MSDQPHRQPVHRRTAAVYEWHVVIPGLLQREGDVNGMVRLWRSIHLERSGPQTCVDLRSWNSNWSDVAELIWRFRPRDKDPAIRLYGYSYGGYGAILLAEQLRRRGLEVGSIVLSDAVRRWRACWPAAALTVPVNVREVHWFYQRTDWPRGHRVVAADPDHTVIHDQVLVMRSHRWMDDLESFHELSRQVARGEA